MPTDRPPWRPSDIQDLFFREWMADRQEGITPRATQRMLSEHLAKDEGFQAGILQRLAGLEKGEERDREERMLNGKGSHPEIHVDTHVELPPPSRLPSLKPWWSRDPWKSVIKYVLVGFTGLVLGWVARHYGLALKP